MGHYSYNAAVESRRELILYFLLFLVGSLVVYIPFNNWSHIKGGDGD